MRNRITAGTFKKKSFYHESNYCITSEAKTDKTNLQTIKFVLNTSLTFVIMKKLEVLKLFRYSMKGILS